MRVSFVVAGAVGRLANGDRLGSRRVVALAWWHCHGKFVAQQLISYQMGFVRLNPLEHGHGNS